MTLVDSHCHAGLNWFEPVESLLFQMDSNGIDKAVLIQHSGSYDNSYLFDSMRQHPGRFAAVVQIDIAQSNASAKLEKLVAEGAVGIRLNPTTRSNGSDPLEIWRKASELGIAVSLLGEVADFATDEFAALVSEMSDLTIIIEHLAGIRYGARPPYAIYKKALKLGEMPNTYIKVGGLGEFLERPPVLKSEFGFDQMLPVIDMALEAFGPRRMMWGSDFPGVSQREGYKNSLVGIKEHPAFKSNEDIALVMGMTALSVFRF